MNWKYKLKSGSALREAIYKDDAEQTVKCLLLCYKELYSKLSEEDKEWKGIDIEDAIDTLNYIDSIGVDEDEMNNHLADFYDICDDVGAWIEV